MFKDCQSRPIYPFTYGAIGKVAGGRCLATQKVSSSTEVIRTPVESVELGLNVTKKVGLITGITGQDGSYLAELLLRKGYDVHGVVRRTSSFNRARIDHARSFARSKGQRLELHYGDLSDSSSLSRIVSDTKPDEIYNLAAQSHVQVSFETAESTCDINGVGTLRLLEAIRSNALPSKFYQASTSELFGKVTEIPQTEVTPFYPRSPYGVSKLYAHWIVKNYREAFGLFGCNGILFNHESPRRAENFVTRKITSSLARIKAGLQDVLSLGNLSAKRDWGFAGDYVEAMWLMLQENEPRDYVVATGETYTVRDFVERAAKYAGFDIGWEGDGVDEIGRDRRSGAVVVSVDPKYFRPSEVDILIGDATLARNTLGWKPRVSFEELVEMMMRADLDLLASSRSGLQPNRS